MSKDKKIAVYIASPYTDGDVAVNVRRSIIAADRLVELGLYPFVPLLTHFWHFLSPKDYEVWTEMDMEWVRRCDCVLRLMGNSKGADAEVSLAESLGIPVFYNIESLADYCESLWSPKYETRIIRS